MAGMKGNPRANLQAQEISQVTWLDAAQIDIGIDSDNRR